MPSEPPKKRFAIAARRDQNLKDHTIKDNAQPRIRPPQMARRPPPNLAPPGMKGITPRFKPPPANTNTQAFSVKPGNLSREFKPLAGKDKDHGHER